MEQAKAGSARQPGSRLRYTQNRRREFLRVLAETYNIEAACAAGRFSWPDVCELRVRHPDFAVRFDEVIAAGYDRLEAMLLRQAGIGGGGKVDPVLAQALLKQRRTGKADAAAGARKGAAATPPREEMIQSVMDKLAPLKAVRTRGSGVNGQADRGGARLDQAGAGGG